MKKIIVLISFILLSGCSAEYNLIYENNTFYETSSINTNHVELCGTELCETYFNEFYNSNISINYMDDAEELATNENLNNFKFYEKKIINDINDYKINLNYNYDNETDYETSYIVHNLYDKVLITEDKMIFYEIKNIFEKYPYLTNITITFKTDKYIKKTNSDELKDDKYYWYINKSNYENKRIEIDFDKEKNDSNTFVKDNLLTSTFIKYFLIILVLIILFIIIIIYEKIKNSNK